MYGAVNYIREKDWAPEDLQIHPMWSTPKCWMEAWRNRDGPRGVSHTAEWTGLSGSSELTPRGRGRRQRGLFVFFFFSVDGEYWHTGDTGKRAGRRG